MQTQAAILLRMKQVFNYNFKQSDVQVTYNI